MKKVIIATAAAIAFIAASPAFAGPAEEAASDYPGLACHSTTSGWPRDSSAPTSPTNITFL
jgi:hypothetical protein